MAPTPDIGPQSIEVPGTTIGRYELVQIIGEGGMGTVWLAEQREPVKRRVALKLVKLGMDTREVISRFETERQALAMMDHPNIAKVFDAGATEHGRPYFVMEHIDGVPFLEHCDTHRLDTRARLRLFVGVCQAIQHAHQKGIIHRDIKPSNVLITMQDGVATPKVIDFGIAKATQGELTARTIFTEFRQLIGTPAYMSPEQAGVTGSDIDTRSDIYSLGVLLYELLTSTTPFDIHKLLAHGYDEMLRVIREETPHKPSTRVSTLVDAGPRTAEQRHTDIRKLGLALRGDLDWIVMRCLEKDRARRYETASGLALDIERHLNGEAVVAAPPSAAYRVRKFIRRHRAAVLAGLAMFVLLVLGIVGTSVGLVRALDATTLAERRATQIEDVSKFQAQQYGKVNASKMGAGLRTALLDAAPEAQRTELAQLLEPINFTGIALSSLERDLFSQTLAAIDERFHDQPLVRAQLLQSMASLVRDVGLLDLATGPQREAFAICEQEHGPDHVDTIGCQHQLGYLLMEQEKFAEAETVLRAALDHARQALGADHATTLGTTNSLALLLDRQRRRKEAEPLYREALAGYRRTLGEDHPDTIRAISNLGGVLRLQEHYAEAEPFYREALERYRRVLGDDDEGTISTTSGLGSLLRALGKLQEAETCLRTVLAADRNHFGNDHPYALDSMSNLASLLQEQGAFDEAEALFREALAGRRKVLGDESPGALGVQNNLARLLQARGDTEQAETLYKSALDAQRRRLGADHPDTLTTLDNLGTLYQAQDRFDEADECRATALAARRRTSGNEDARTLNAMRGLGVLRVAEGRYAEAETLFAEALETQRRVFGPQHNSTQITAVHLGACLRELGRYEESLVLLQAAYDASRESRALRFAGFELLELHVQAGATAQANALARELLARAREQNPEPTPALADALVRIGKADLALRAWDDAEPLLREALAIRTQAEPDGAPALVVQSLLGAAIAGRGEHDAARASLESAFEGLAKRAATGTPDRRRLAREAGERLATAYDAWQITDPSAGYAERATAIRTRIDALGAGATDTLPTEGH